MNSKFPSLLKEQGSALMPEFGNFRAGSFALHRGKKNDAKDNIQWINDPSGISGIDHFLGRCGDLSGL